MAKAIRGELWEVSFQPSVGAEIHKNRPAVVLNVAEVGVLPLVIVVPITEWQLPFARRSWFVYLAPTDMNGLMKESGADAFQVKSVSESRLLRRLGCLTEDETNLIAEAVALCIGV